MSILNRLSQIVRSNLGPKLGSPSGDAEHDFEFDDESIPFEAEQNHPDYDEVLAGYYANLELEYGASLEDIQIAWKRLLKQYHPDRHAADPEKARVANELVQQINHAYEQLKTHLENRKN